VSIFTSFFENFGAFTRRDYVAMEAMKAMVGSLREGETINTDSTAVWAYEMADAMARASRGEITFDYDQGEIEYD